MSGEGSERERERERETQNLKQAPDSELSAKSLTWDLNSGAMRSCPEQKSDSNHLSFSRAPQPRSLKQRRLPPPRPHSLALYLDVWPAMCLFEIAIFEEDALRHLHSKKEKTVKVYTTIHLDAKASESVVTQDS